MNEELTRGDRDRDYEEHSEEGRNRRKGKCTGLGKSTVSTVLSTHHVAHFLLGKAQPTGKPRESRETREGVNEKGTARWLIYIVASIGH